MMNRTEYKKVRLALANYRETNLRSIWRSRKRLSRMLLSSTFRHKRNKNN